MTVQRASAKHFFRQDGTGHYFCSAGCKAEVRSRTGNLPRRRASLSRRRRRARNTLARCIRRSSATSLAPARYAAWRWSRWACRPAMRGPIPSLSTSPGACGSALRWRCRCLSSTMGPMLGLPIRDWLGERARRLAGTGACYAVVLWAALPFFHRGWQSIVNRSPNMWTLISIGVGAAYLYSVAATLFPDIFPHQLRGHGDSVPVYFEAAAVIVALVFLGQVLELKARERTGSAIRALLDLAPKTARRIGDGWRGNRCAAGCGAHRRPAARASGRERSGGRPGRGRPLVGGRIHAHRRAASGGEGEGRCRHRRHAQPQRHAGDARRKGRRRHHAVAHRRDGRQGAAQPRADPGAGRQGVRLFRAGRRAGRHPFLRHLGSFRPAARAWSSQSSRPSRC